MYLGNRVLIMHHRRRYRHWHHYCLRKSMTILRLTKYPPGHLLNLVSGFHLWQTDWCCHREQEWCHLASPRILFKFSPYRLRVTPQLLLINYPGLFTNNIFKCFGCLLLYGLVWVVKAINVLHSQRFYHVFLLSFCLPLPVSLFLSIYIYKREREKNSWILEHIMNVLYVPATRWWNSASFRVVCPGTPSRCPVHQIHRHASNSRRWQQNSFVLVLCWRPSFGQDAMMKVLMNRGTKMRWTNCHYETVIDDNDEDGRFVTKVRCGCAIEYIIYFDTHVFRS